MNWLIDNHPSYYDIERPQHCPQPILVGGFNETVNNTDDPGVDATKIESSLGTEEFSYSSRNEPSEKNRTIQN